MKKVKMSLAYALMLSLPLLLASCGKDGDQGPEGPAGPAGPAGTKGDPGSANVIYSAWTDLAFTPDIPSPGDTVGFYRVWAVPKLDNTILNSGEIKVYLKFLTSTNATAVVPLPYLDSYSFNTIDVTFLLNTIQLYASFNSSTRTNTTTGAKTLQYRYVLIPGGVPARSAVNWNDYESVKKYLGLKD